LLDGIFGTPASLKSHRLGSENNGNCWPFFQCVLQKARLAIATQKNQSEAIALLKNHIPESSVALELMGDLYGMQSNSALACYENAMRCTSNEQKERLQQKINKLQNR